MKNFFLSLKTAVWLLTCLICVFFLGSYLMPAYRDVHGAMNDRLLFEWVEQVALDHPWVTGWFFLALTALVLLTINTLACSIQAVRGKWSREDFLLRISPQLVHGAFLVILLAHLLGAGWGYRLSGMLPEGASVRLPGDRVLFLREIRAESDPRGYVRDWSARIILYESGRPVADGLLGPNAPLFYGGMGVYLKSFELQPSPAAFLLVTRDPGAVWALAGSVLFVIGTVIILFLKWKKI
jgi:cytochrome c biogenesis protein ResB